MLSGGFFVYFCEGAGEGNKTTEKLEHLVPNSDGAASCQALSQVFSLALLSLCCPLPVRSTTSRNQIIGLAVTLVPF